MTDDCTYDDHALQLNTRHPRKPRVGILHIFEKQYWNANMLTADSQTIH
jgi:hypothetical protein